jgi:hypothetical protein
MPVSKESYEKALETMESYEELASDDKNRVSMRPAYIAASMLVAAYLAENP